MPAAMKELRPKSAAARWISRSTALGVEAHSIASKRSNADWATVIERLQPRVPNPGHQPTNIRHFTPSSGDICCCGLMAGRAGGQAAPAGQAGFASGPAIIVFDSDDVVLAEIAAGLHLD